MRNARASYNNYFNRGDDRWWRLEIDFENKSRRKSKSDRGNEIVVRAKMHVTTRSPSVT